ncbi:3660_t:CDS:2 [Entrophospora sp. SA101]|nr:3660_t:CDS:2 [Entrophospora sp. SA101]
MIRQKNNLEERITRQAEKHKSKVAEKEEKAAYMQKKYEYIQERRKEIEGKSLEEKSFYDEAQNNIRGLVQAWDREKAEVESAYKGMIDQIHNFEQEALQILQKFGKIHLLVYNLSCEILIKINYLTPLIVDSRNRIILGLEYLIIYMVKGWAWNAEGCDPMEIQNSAVLIRTNLDCPDGYICQYTRRNPLEVYVDVNNFGKSLDVLVEIIYAKLLVLQTMKVVNDSVDGKSNVTRWKKQAKSDRSNITTIPDVHPSPKR